MERPHRLERLRKQRQTLMMSSVRKINPEPPSSQVPFHFPFSIEFSPTALFLYMSLFTSSPLPPHYPPSLPSTSITSILTIPEYLSHGYTLTDQALQKAIEVDHTHGLSKRFYGLLNTALGTAQGVDQKFGVTQRAVAVDERYAIQEKAKSTATGLMRYFESALDSPTGKKVRGFYDDSKKQALDIHAEARRYMIPFLFLVPSYPFLILFIYPFQSSISLVYWWFMAP